MQKMVSVSDLEGQNCDKFKENYYFLTYTVSSRCFILIGINPILQMRNIDSQKLCDLLLVRTNIWIYICVVPEPHFPRLLATPLKQKHSLFLPGAESGLAWKWVLWSKQQGIFFEQPSVVSKKEKKRLVINISVLRLFLNLDFKKQNVENDFELLFSIHSINILSSAFMHQVLCWIW